MADSMYIVSLSTEYGPCGYFFNSPESKETIIRNLAYCIEMQKAWELKQEDGTVLARYNGITGYGVIECTPENKVQ